MGRPIWVVRLLKLLYKQKKIAAWVTNLPVIGDVIEKSIFSGDNLYCLPKDHIIHVNESVTPQGDIILPSRVAESFVERANFHWIMNFCICRSSNKCKDYPIELGCLFLGEAAMGINPKIGRRATKEEALDHMKKSRDAGLVHFIGRVKGDSLWLGVGPDNKLLTICNCCPCCCISGMIPYMAPQIAKNYKKLPGVEVRVTDSCVGCGTCVDICFVNAIQIIEKKAVIGNVCRGCGRCVEKCPQKAIELTLTDEHFLEKTIDSISDCVNVT
ncbi:MAG: 4Fe-4S binding protein [Candidatus Helarchaeota archaeon]|nr:4Fe-4S binding protein [Candidatus Helarchaeota archaeon]